MLLRIGMVGKEIGKIIPTSFQGSMLLLLLLSCLSCVRLCVTPEMASHQAPPSLGFSRQEHLSGLPFPPPKYLPNPGIEPMSPAALALQADSLPSEPSGKPSVSPTELEMIGKIVLCENIQPGKSHSRLVLSSVFTETWQPGMSW